MDGGLVEPWTDLQSPSICFCVRGHAIINNKSEEKGNRELFVECDEFFLFLMEQFQWSPLKYKERAILTARR